MQSLQRCSGASNKQAWLTLGGEQGKPGGTWAVPPAAALLGGLEAVVPVIDGHKAAVHPISTGGARRPDRSVAGHQSVPVLHVGPQTCMWRIASLHMYHFRLCMSSQC